MVSWNALSRSIRDGSWLVVALSLLSLSAVGCGDADAGASPQAGDERDSIGEGTAPRADTARGEDGSGEEESVGDREGDRLASNADETHPIVSCAGEPAASAPYEIQSRSVDGDVLTIVLTHGGGCAPHDFRLCYEPELLETNPVQVNLRLDHDAHGDVCERIDRKVLEFDLQSLRDHYRAANPNGDTVVLNLGEPITYEL